MIKSIKNTSMMYALPHSIFTLLENAFNGDRKKAETFGEAIEKAIQSIEKKAEEKITDKKTEIIATVKEDIRGEMASKEFVRAEINGVKIAVSEVKSEINEVKIMLKVLIGLALFGITLANPQFIQLMKAIF